MPGPIAADQEDSLSKTLDDSTAATNPGAIPLSDERLKRLHPELYSRFLWMKTQKAYTVRAFLDGGATFRLRFKEHLAEGDARAAIVVSTSPLLVAAYTDEIDCVAMLYFPEHLVAAHGLRPGSRLLTVNLYGSLRRNKYQDDLHPGPGNSKQFGELWPLIADFLTTNDAVLRRRKASIRDDEWQKVTELAAQYFEQHGFFARDGLPRLSGRPATPRSAKAGHSESCRPVPVGPKFIIRTGTQRLEAHGVEELNALIARGDVLPDHQVLDPSTRTWVRVEELKGLQ